MRDDERWDLELLNELAQGEHLTQRALAKKLGITLGLANLRLKRLVEKGYIEAVHVGRNRIRYLLTPQGAAERSRLSAERLSDALALYRDIRSLLRERLKVLAKAGCDRVVLYGTGEVAELAYLALKEMGLILVGVVDEQEAGKSFLGLPVLPPSRLPTLRFDAVVIASLTPLDGKVEGPLALGISKKKIFLLKEEVSVDLSPSGGS